MEHHTQQSETHHDRSLQLSQNGLLYLITAAKWASFLAIVGFVFVGISALTILSLLLGGNFLALDSDDYTTPGTLAGFGIAYLLFLAFFSAPVYFLYKFSAKAKKAIARHNNEYLEESINFLQKHFKFVGIIVIITLAFNLLGLFVGVVFGIFDAIAGAQ